jgi:outer membrane protein assembly factor BamB
MTNFKSFFCIFAIIFLASCSEKKAPPLTGERVNVLHFDSLQDKKAAGKKVVLPAQATNNFWPASDSQVNFLPENSYLAANLNLKSKLSLKKFYPNMQDSSVIIVGDMVYTYSKGTLSANDTAKNQLSWSVQLVNSKDRSDILSGSIIYNDNLIFVATGTKDMVVVDAQNGKEKWRYTASNVVRYIPLINNSRIYLTTIDNIISCLSLDGNLLWRHDAAPFAIALDSVYAPTIIHDNKVFLATTAGDLVIIDNSNGEELLQVNLANISVIGDGSLAKGPISSPYLERNFLYILTGESELLKIDLQLPGVAWRQTFPGAVSTWITKDATYLLMDNNQLLALDNNDAKIIWVKDLPKRNNKKSDEFFGPVLAGDNLYLTSAYGGLFAFNPTDGSFIKKYDASPSKLAPLVVNNKMFVVSKNGKLEIWQ